MHAKSNKLLFDAARAEADIREFCAGRSLAEHRGDAMLRAAVERKFEIIGEAAGRLRALDAATFARITSADAIVAFRHRLIHGYDQVDDEIVWDTVQYQLPALLAEVRGLLDLSDETPGGSGDELPTKP